MILPKNCLYHNVIFNKNRKVLHHTYRITQNFLHMCDYLFYYLHTVVFAL